MVSKSAPVSFRVSNRAHVSSVADSVKASIGRGAKSVTVTVRGARSALVNLLEVLKDNTIEASAVLTIRGDKAGR